VTLDVQQMFKVMGSKVRITARHIVSPVKNRCISQTDRWAFKLCENYTTAYFDTWKCSSS